MSLTYPHVLLITQDGSLPDFLSSICETERLTFVHAVDHESAVNIVQRTDKTCNIVVIDYTTPFERLDLTAGRIVGSINAIRAWSPTTDAIVVTDGDRAPGVDALEAGAFDYIDKSVLNRELPIRINQLMEVQRLKGLGREDSLFKSLAQVRYALAAGEDDDKLLNITLKGIQSIGFSRVRLYLLSEDGPFLLARAHLGMKPEFQGAKLPLDQCYFMNELMREQLPRVFQRQDDRPVPFEDLLEKTGVGEWACVPLKLKDRIIGKVSVDNKLTGHRILQDDLDLILPFASEAVEIIESARQSRRVEALHEAIISITATGTRDELLKAITREAMRLASARDCGIYAYHKERKELVVITNHRHPEFEGKKMLRLGQGAAGSLIESGEPFLIIPNYSESEYKTEVYEGKDFGTVLEVLLKSGQETVGVLYVDDAVGRHYSDNDIQLIRLFADRAAMALTHIEREERLERLIDSSPLGIIEVKRGGAEFKGQDAIVTGINKAAEDILKYQPEEARGIPVSRLYADPEEPKKIGELLKQKKGRLSDYLTNVRTKEGKIVPIRHAATWLLDSTGRRTGSVGFFEDLTSITEKERQFEVLLTASNLITGNNITAGLNALARLMVEKVGGTFCRILLIDEAGEVLVPKAAYRVGHTPWDPAIEVPAHISDWPLLPALLRARKPAVRRFSDHEVQPYLAKLDARLKLENPIISLLVVPLTVDESVIGLLQVGEERAEGGTTFDQTAIDLAAAIGAQTAVLIRRERARLRFESMFKASTALVSPDDPDQVLLDVVESTRQAAGANSVSLVQIDEHGRAINLTTAGADPIPGIARLIRPNGISMTVWEKGEPVSIEDTRAKGSNFNPAMDLSEIGAAVCLPVTIQGSRLGVVWVHYREPRRFREYDIENLQLCVNQAALAYDSSRRISELKRIREAAKVLAAAGMSQEEVLKEIVRSACYALQADSSVIWFFDGQNFVGEQSQSHGIADDVWQVFKKRGPRQHGTARRIMEAADGRLEVPDIDDRNDLGPRTQELLRLIGASRFLGIALRVGDDTQGVLYVNFRQPRSFRQEEREMILSFGNQAAFALKRWRLVDQIEKTRRTANVVAEVTTLGDLRTTLDLVVDGTRSSLGCDAVTLFVYDPERNCLESPPSMAGVWFRDRASQYTVVPPGSMVFTVLNSKDIITVSDVRADPLFRDSRFAAHEEIESCAAIPLRVGEEPVGVMFVNYRSRHLFSASETADIKLFSNQAAIAIHNARLFDRTRKDLEDREQFLKLSNRLLDTLDLQETMDCAVRFAAEALETGFCSLAMPYDDRRLVFSAGCGWPEEMVGKSYLGRGRKSQSGYTIETGQPFVVEDFTTEQPFEVSEIVSRYNLLSALSVPMVIDADVTAALLVHAHEKRRFGEAQINQLQLIANQTAIAIRSARRHESTEKARAQVQALYDASGAVAVGSGREDILREIVRRAVEYLQPRAVLGTLHAYDVETDELTLVTAHPPSRFDTLVADIGERRPLRGNERTRYKMGIIGRAVITGETQNVANSDTDYVELDPATRSELAVPLKENDRVIGVLNIESDRKNAFDSGDEKTVETLAKLSSMAVKSETQFKLVVARTALVFMGLSANTWFHGVRNKVLSIRDNLTLADLKLADQRARIPEELKEIGRLVNVIISMPKLEALSKDEGVIPVLLNSHLTERVKQLRDELKKEHPLIRVTPRFELANDVTVRVNPTWLEQAIDVLIDNAVEAMRQSPDKELTIGTTRAKGYAVIKVEDTGGGIPDELLSKLGEEQVSSRGLGLGLLMARFILQIYGGDIAIESTSPEGTTFIARLPMGVN